jgi:hypothetical protein
MSDKATPKRRTLSSIIKGTPQTAPSTPSTPEESGLAAAEEEPMVRDSRSTSWTDEFEGSSLGCASSLPDDASISSLQTFSVSGGSFRGLGSGGGLHDGTQYSVEDLTRIVKDMTTKQQDTYFHYLRKKEEVKSLESSMVKLAHRVGEMNQDADARKKEIEKVSSGR